MTVVAAKQFIIDYMASDVNSLQALRTHTAEFSC